jgi:hypothetical protein
MTVTQVVFPQAAGAGFNFRNQTGSGAFAFLGPMADYGMLIIIAIIVVAAAAIAAAVILRRRSKAKRLRQTGGMDENIEDILQEPTSESKNQQRSKSREDRMK